MAKSWFKHDYGARNDDDILELRAEYGWKGYGLFYAFIETMAENETGAIDLDKIGGLSIGYNLPKEELLAFVETCLNIGLFYKDDDGFIRNSRITKHIEKLKSFREAGKKGAKKRWSDDSDKGANRGASDTPMQSRVDKSREEESKEEKTYTPELEDVIQYFAENGYTKKSAEKFYNYYEASIEGTQKKYWRDSKGNMVKSWKQKAQAVWFKPENEIKQNGKSQFRSDAIHL